MSSDTALLNKNNKNREELDDVVVRFAGDSGDGVQITGGQFTITTALAGNDLTTFPDFPAEIRAPAGTTFGVSAYSDSPRAQRCCSLESFAHQPRAQFALLALSGFCILATATVAIVSII